MAAAFAGFLDRYGGFFRTRTRNNAVVARRYLCGLAQAEDCTFEAMAAVVEDGCAQQFQHFISNSPWDHEPVVAQIGEDADRLLGDKPTSALIIDESSFPKQGDRSVGVARQWAGRLGKVDNCQVAVFAVLTDGERHTPVDMRFYLPDRWIKDPARCELAGIPEAARKKISKSEHALDIVRRARARGIRFAFVGADAGYGKEPGFLRAREDATGLDRGAGTSCSRVQPGPWAPVEDAEGRHAPRHRRETGQGRSSAGLDALHLTRLHARKVAGRYRVPTGLGLGRRGRAAALLASDHPPRSRIGHDDQIHLLERPGRYAPAPVGPDAGATLLGRARFRRRQGRVRPGRLSGAGMALMASPRDDGDAGDVVHPRTTRRPTAWPRIADAARHRGDAQRDFAAQAGGERGARRPYQRAPRAPSRRHRIPLPHPTQKGLGLNRASAGKCDSVKLIH